MWYSKMFKCHVVESRLTGRGTTDRCGGITEEGIQIDVVMVQKRVSWWCGSLTEWGILIYVIVCRMGAADRSSGLTLDKELFLHKVIVMKSYTRRKNNLEFSLLIAFEGKIFLSKNESSSAYFIVALYSEACSNAACYIKSGIFSIIYTI